MFTVLAAEELFRLLASLKCLKRLIYLSHSCGFAKLKGSGGLMLKVATGGAAISGHDHSTGAAFIKIKSKIFSEFTEFRLVLWKAGGGIM